MCEKRAIHLSMYSYAFINLLCILCGIFIHDGTEERKTEEGSQKKHRQKRSGTHTTPETIIHPSPSPTEPLAQKCRKRTVYLIKKVETRPVFSVFTYLGEARRFQYRTRTRTRTHILHDLGQKLNLIQYISSNIQLKN